MTNTQETRVCPTCFSNVRFPRERRNAQRLVIEMCVDKCHDKDVLERPGDAARFLRAAIKQFRAAKLPRGTGATLSAEWLR